MISALFIAQSFPKWFVHFWMTFCKNIIGISCQIIFVNKHWTQSCLCPFKGYRYTDIQTDRHVQSNMPLLFKEGINIFHIVLFFSIVLIHLHNHVHVITSKICFIIALLSINQQHHENHFIDSRQHVLLLLYPAYVKCIICIFYCTSMAHFVM